MTASLAQGSLFSRRTEPPFERRGTTEGGGRLTAQADGYAVHSVETVFDNLPSRSACHPLSKEGFRLVPYPMHCLRRTTVGAAAGTPHIHISSLFKIFGFQSPFKCNTSHIHYNISVVRLSIGFPKNIQRKSAMVFSVYMGSILTFFSACFILLTDQM